MTLSRSAHLQIATIALIVAALGTANWILTPAHALTWAIGMGTMAAIWLVAILTARAKSVQTKSEQGYLVFSVVIAGLMLAVSFGIKLAVTLGFEVGFWRDRAFGVATGVLLVAMGNLVPKMVRPLTAKRCSPTQTQSVQRFTGWTFVLAGLATIAAWIFLAIPQADTVGTYACAGAVALVIARCTWAFASPRQAERT